MGQVKLMIPLKIDVATLRLNKTLHGRSVHRVQDVPGHNVVKGYNSPGKGDAVDYFIAAGSPVYATHAGQVVHMGDLKGKLSCLYLDGVVTGIDVISVYAHLRYAEGVTPGTHLKAGELLGWVDHKVSDPHLHFELWVDGHAISGATAQVCRDAMVKYFV